MVVTTVKSHPNRGHLNAIGKAMSQAKANKKLFSVRVETSETGSVFHEFFLGDQLNISQKVEIDSDGNAYVCHRRVVSLSETIVLYQKSLAIPGAVADF